jgi:hypothetical protein
MGLYTVPGRRTVTLRSARQMTHTLVWLGVRIMGEVTQAAAEILRLG